LYSNQLTFSAVVAYDDGNDSGGGGGGGGENDCYVA